MLMDESFSISAQPTEFVQVRSFKVDDSKSASKLKVPFDENRPVSCWEETLQGNRHVEICLAPNLVCSQAKQTAGGGDNISAAGLIVQL